MRTFLCRKIGLAYGGWDWAITTNCWRCSSGRELHSLKPRERDSVQPSVACQLASGVQTILGLEVDGHLVGAVAATHDSRKGWVNRLVIDPTYRRRGYGARLIAAAEQVLREQGMRAIAANLTSLALFQKVGYVEVDPRIHYLSKRDSDAVWK